MLSYKNTAKKSVQSFVLLGFFALSVVFLTTPDAHAAYFDTGWINADDSRLQGDKYTSCDGKTGVNLGKRLGNLFADINVPSGNYRIDIKAAYGQYTDVEKQKDETITAQTGSESRNIPDLDNQSEHGRNCAAPQPSFKTFNDIAGGTMAFPENGDLTLLGTGSSIGLRAIRVYGETTPPPTPSPTADIKANGSDGPITIASGSSASISWTSTNAASCTVSPSGWTGVSGSQYSPALFSTATYVVNCSGAGGNATDSVQINIQNPPPPQNPPTVTISANPSSINQGNSSVLIWSSANADTCTASGGWSGGKSTSGSETVYPSATTGYSINCSNAYGSATANATVTVWQITPTVTISANPTSITQGNSSVLTWTSQNATSCSASGGWSGNKNLSGSETVTPAQTSFYTITCSNTSGSANSSATIYVNSPPTPSPTADIKANGSDGPITIASGSSASISWTSTNAASCTVSPSGWTGVSGSQTTGSLTYSALYSVSCNGAGGYVYDSVQITVSQPPQQQLPTISLYASPSYIYQGNSSALTWSSQNATTCTASDGWSGNKAISGSENVNPSATTGYSITCSNAYGSATANTTVTVWQTNPTVTISANPSYITQGNSSVLTWTSQNATSCSASGGWSGGKSTSGSETVYPSATTYYYINCTGSGGSVSAQTMVAVNYQQPAYNLPTVSLNANPTSINQGASSYLSWSSQNATSCSVSGGWSGSRGTYGSETVYPVGTTSYSITCSNGYGVASDSETVYVNQNQYSAPASVQIIKSVRNITLNQSSFSDFTDAQGLDVLEFEIRVRNTSQYAKTASVRDILPPEIFFTANSTYVNIQLVSDGIVSGGINLGTLNPNEEKIVVFRAVVFYGTQEKTITNQAIATIESASQTDNANIQIKNRGRVLGAADVVTGPENPFLPSLIIGLFASMLAYAVFFKYRYYPGVPLKEAYYDAKFKTEIAFLRMEEGADSNL